MAPSSTREFYRQLAQLARENLPDRAYPTIIIYSVNMAEFRKKLRSGDTAATVSFLLEVINSLSSAGADFAVIASITPHMFIDELKEKSPIPLVNMVEETAREAKNKGFPRVGLFGTGFTMEADFFPRTFEKFGVSVSIPSPEEREYIDNKTMAELADGKIESATREKLVEICRRLTDEEGIEALILGSTELSLILNDEVLRIPVLDTARISTRVVFDYSQKDEAK